MQRLPCVHVWPAAISKRFPNTPADIEQLVAWVQPYAAERIVFESTGPYQKAAVVALLAAGLPAVVVNARQVRDFPKGTGQLAKTDVIAALVGLAPFADDSGTVNRIRHIRGGRGKVRIALYQAAVAAIRYCDTMKSFYASLKARGKASKVALIAVARKFLVLAQYVGDQVRPKVPALGRGRAARRSPETVPTRSRLRANRSVPADSACFRS